jgi:hypothetical protein
MLEAAIERTVGIWQMWKRLQTNGMSTDVGWTRSASNIEVFKRAVKNQDYR